MDRQLAFPSRRGFPGSEVPRSSARPSRLLHHHSGHHPVDEVLALWTILFISDDDDDNGGSGDGDDSDVYLFCGIIHWTIYLENSER